MIMPNSNSGVYTVIAELLQATDLTIGRRRNDSFEKGFYAYVGSALNGLEKRLGRHLGKRKKLHWHIDYFLESAVVREIVFAPTIVNMECSIARSLSDKLSAIPGFGCSDCHCRSHLYYNPAIEDLTAAVLSGFKQSNLTTGRLIPENRIWIRQENLTGGSRC